MLVTSVQHDQLAAGASRCNLSLCRRYKALHWALDAAAQPTLPLQPHLLQLYLSQLGMQRPRAGGLSHQCRRAPSQQLNCSVAVATQPSEIDSHLLYCRRSEAHSRRLAMKAVNYYCDDATFSDDMVKCRWYHPDIQGR